MEAGLNSEKGVDYTHLHDLLAARKWKEADIETTRVMLQAVHRLQDGYMDLEDVKKFPCTDLLIVDRLWVQYSDGRFGFSVQKEIHQYLNCPQEYDKTATKALARHVGWYAKGYWLRYDDLTFDLTAPRGHLPSQLWVEDKCEWYAHITIDGMVGMVDGSSYLFDRIEACINLS